MIDTFAILDDEAPSIALAGFNRLLNNTRPSARVSDSCESVRTECNVPFSAMGDKSISRSSPASGTRGANFYQDTRLSRFRCCSTRLISESLTARPRGVNLLADCRSVMESRRMKEAAEIVDRSAGCLAINWPRFIRRAVRCRLRTTVSVDSSRATNGKGTRDFSACLASDD